MGGIGFKMKKLLKKIASKASVRKRIPHSMVINSIGKKIISCLMKENVNMVLSSTLLK